MFNYIIEVAEKVESKHLGSIYRVLKEVRKLKKSAYAPQLVSIGPLHSNDKHILNSPVQDIKMNYVNALLYRVEHGSTRRRGKSDVLTACLNEMEGLIGFAQKCYAETVEALEKEMLVIDGCFILELLYRHHHRECSNSKPKPDPIFDIPQTYSTIQTDLLLLENQLPFFVLEGLFRQTIVHIRDRPLNLSLIDYVLSFFGNIWNFESKGRATTPVGSFGEVNYYHILHILHKYHQPSECQNLRVCSQDHLMMPCASEDHLMMPCASELEYAGVKFCPNKTEGDLFMIDFQEPEGLFKWLSRADLNIPTFNIYDSTETFLRNLIAFEQSCPDVPFYFTSYAFFMDKLINTPKDVEVLEKAGVIGMNALGAKEDASNLFNKLCKEVNLPPKKFYFAKTCKDVAKYSKRFWPSAVAYVRSQYFANPWTFIAFSAGFLVFCITVVEFIYTFIS